MIFAPHILQRKEENPPQADEFGRVIATSTAEWVSLCRCRCNDNTTQEFTNVNGSVYRPNFHIVCEGRAMVKAGDVIRCIANDEIICEGKIYQVKRNNWFNAFEVWL